MDSDKQIGWLVHAGYVICIECRPNKPTFTEEIRPIWWSNIYPYSQKCAYCKKELNPEKQFDTQLFDILSSFSTGEVGDREQKFLDMFKQVEEEKIDTKS